ncbi:spliceosome RNA helicase DDX39B-like [Neofelis nebulosa]|uniref:spliceosome RNA helicase DDX39B-like n=1 Tax=Neofelis nebulosa TaxID=61452 RepID=UPI00272B29DC|nr:spliceosome RNA helicase DDX39B-like [Neofelis nebulosa]XP_058592100.1 spliceosome RNA helicase DDX39B-like [Neofelis nebulosa]
MDIKQVNSTTTGLAIPTPTCIRRPVQASCPRGLSITFVSSENSAKILSEVQGQTEVDGTELPEEMDISSSIAVMGEDAPIHRA